MLCKAKLDNNSNWNNIRFVFLDSLPFPSQSSSSSKYQNIWGKKNKKIQKTIGKK